jgi:hypothetical protein
LRKKVEISQVEQQLIPDCGKMEQPMMHGAEDIQIAAEDDTDDGGAIANSDCGRKWHSGCWSNVKSVLRQKTAISMVEKQQNRIA